MSKKKLILIGGGGHAKACVDVINSTDKFHIVGYFDKIQTIEAKFDIPYLGDDSNIDKYVNDVAFLVTVGQIESANIRIRLYEYLSSIKAELATVISKHAIVSEFANIGNGTIIMHSAIIQSNVTIGNNCIINDRALIEHDVEIGNHCHISTGSILNGAVKVGNSTFIGSGAIIKNGLEIGDNATIGFGSLIKENIQNSQTWVGSLSKQII
jgi:sugar O-acyltransferase (sialic acid O-acetyltransferase NeuD family)